MAQTISPASHNETRKYLLDALEYVLKPNFPVNIQREDWTIHEAACLCAGLEPLSIANMASLHAACTSDNGRAIQYQPETQHAPRKLARRNIERNDPDHPKFEPIRLFDRVPGETPEEEANLNARLKELASEFVKRYGHKLDIERAANFAVADGHLPAHRHEVRIGSSWIDQFRRVSPVVAPKDFVSWASMQRADLPAELRAIVERHEEPAPLKPDSKDGARGQPEKPKSRKGAGGRPKGPSKREQARIDKRVYNSRKTTPPTPYEAIERELNLTHEQALKAYERQRKRKGRTR